MAKGKHFGALAAAAGALVAVALLVLMLVLVNPQTAGATLPGTNGRIAYAAQDGQDMDIFTVSPNFGAPVQLTFNNTSDHSPSYSPDGKRIAYVDNAGNNGQIFTMKTDGTDKFQVTPNTADASDPSFTGPKGTHIVYSGQDPNGADNEIFTIPATGGTPNQLTFNNTWDWDPSFTAVRQQIAYQGIDPNGSDREIFTIDATGGTPRKVTDNNVEDSDPDYRPDGRRIVYESIKVTPLPTGDWEIFDVRRPTGIIWQPHQLTFNNTSDYAPSYSPDGQQIAYKGEVPVPAGSYADTEIFTMPATGTATGGQRVQVTFNTAHNAAGISWQPIPASSLSDLRHRGLQKRRARASKAREP